MVSVLCVGVFFMAQWMLRFWKMFHEHPVSSICNYLKGLILA